MGDKKDCVALHVCDDCGRPWVVLSTVSSGHLVRELMAAHDCDGVGVLAVWYRDEMGWTVEKVSSEDSVDVVRGVPPPTTDLQAFAAAALAGADEAAEVEAWAVAAMTRAARLKARVAEMEKDLSETAMLGLQVLHRLEDMARKAETYRLALREASEIASATLERAEHAEAWAVAAMTRAAQLEARRAVQCSCGWPCSCPECTNCPDCGGTGVVLASGEVP